MKDGSFLVVDSGMVSAYRPAVHSRTTGTIGNLIRRISEQFAKAYRRPKAINTTEQGAASAASVATYAMSLYALRYERRAKIADCRAMELDDSRARRAVRMYVEEATRKGFTIVINDRNKYGRTNLIKIAQECAAEIQAMCNPKVDSWGRMAIVEGDLFIQAVVAGDKLVNAKRMPASSMERLTDDADEFINEEDAFEQVDVTTNETVARFPLALMYHMRWDHIDGEKYGEPEMTAVRRARRVLELMEDAQAVRRMTRASQKRVWNVGNPQFPSQPFEVDNWKSNNGFVEGSQEVFDPMNIAIDYFGNGLLDAKVLTGDANIADIDDLTYLQEVYSVGLPTPAAIYGLASESINRDVLKDQRAEWLKRTVTLSDKLALVVRWLMELALLLRGVMPSLVDFTVHFSESSIEEPSEIVERVIKLRQCTFGTGMNAIPAPLISRRRAIQLIAEFCDIDNVDVELEEIKQEEEELFQRQVQMQQLHSVAWGGPSPQEGSKNLPGGQSGHTGPPATKPGESGRAANTDFGALNKPKAQTNGHSNGNGKVAAHR